MPTPRDRYEGLEGSHTGNHQEVSHGSDPVEREIHSSHEILDRVLAHEASPRTIVADIEDLTRWWGRTKALLDMYKPADSIKNYIAIGLAQLGIGQLLGEGQYQTLTQLLIANKKAIDARIEFYLGSIVVRPDEKEDPFTTDTRQLKEDIRTTYGRVAPVAKPR